MWDALYQYDETSKSTTFTLYETQKRPGSSSHEFRIPKTSSKKCKALALEHSDSHRGAHQSATHRIKNVMIDFESERKFTKVRWQYCAQAGCSQRGLAREDARMARAERAAWTGSRVGIASIKARCAPCDHDGKVSFLHALPYLRFRLSILSLI